MMTWTNGFKRFLTRNLRLKVKPLVSAHPYVQEMADLTLGHPEKAFEQHMRLKQWSLEVSPKKRRLSGDLSKCEFLSTVLNNDPPPV